jgi:predicted PurR-regulated permease PerM
VLAAIGLGGVGWLLASAWVDLVPFQVGFALAYITLPLVNWLDHFMPRALAAATVVLIELLSVALFFALLIPPIAGEVGRLTGEFSTSFEPRAMVTQLDERIRALPEPVRDVVVQVTRQAIGTVRDNLALYLQQAMVVAVAGAVSLFATLGFILGFLAIPMWLVAVLTDQRLGQRSLNHILPSWLRGDFWGVMKILDRTLGTYLRGEVMAALAVGAATFVGLALLKQFVWPEIQYVLLLAMIAGALNLIPTLGPIIAAIPAVLVGAFIAPEAAVTILGLYVLVQQLEARFVQPIVKRGSTDIHPAILVVVLVAFAQFGFLWVLLGAPIAVAARDLFRYAYGRFADPPRPAGLLPGAMALSASPRVPSRFRGGPAAMTRPGPVAAIPPEVLLIDRIRRRRSVSASQSAAREMEVVD